MNMKDRIEKGLITLQPLSSSSIESGTIGLVYVDSKAHIVTFEHVNSNGDWYVTGEELSLTLSDHTAYTLATLAENKTSYPIAVKSWKKIIKKDLLNINERSLHDFIITPYKFKEGKSVQTCTECLASFLAARSQPYCRTCCNNMATAELKDSSTTKPKRPRIKTGMEIRQMAIDAYKLGLLGTDELDFQEWLMDKLR